MTGTEVQTRPDGWMTRAEAEADLTLTRPHGHGWSEQHQEWRPNGELIFAENMAKPTDLEANLEAYAKARATVLKFVAGQLQEAEYDKKKYPLKGKLHDYYTLPGRDKKALTKLGAEKIASFFRFAAGKPDVVSQTTERDYCDATVSGVLVDQFNRVAGSAVSSCSTAEAGFQSINSKRKYGGVYHQENREWVEDQAPDFRAALNDVMSRARKRCFVQATIVATATDEIFEVADESGGATEYPEPITEDPTLIPFGPQEGDSLSNCTTEFLERIRDWCEKKDKKPNTVKVITLLLIERKKAERRVPTHPPKDESTDDVPDAIVKAQQDEIQFPGEEPK